MTFSIVGRCAETGQLGIAISSSSIAVGARCPWLRAGVGAVSSQNITLPALGPQILDELAGGSAPPQALDHSLTRNGYSQYRQVAVVDAHGRTAVFSGNHALGINNAVAGDQCVAAGNLLANSGGDRGNGRGVRKQRRLPRHPADERLAGRAGRWRRSRRGALGGVVGGG